MQAPLASKKKKKNRSHLASCNIRGICHVRFHPPLCSSSLTCHQLKQQQGGGGGWRGGSGEMKHAGSKRRWRQIKREGETGEEREEETASEGTRCRKIIMET